jgi:hypothetical protein
MRQAGIRGKRRHSGRKPNKSHLVVITGPTTSDGTYSVQFRFGS